MNIMKTNFNCAFMSAKKAYQTPSIEFAQLQLNSVVLVSPFGFGDDVDNGESD